MTAYERDVFIIGSKGIPAKYGGFETFVEQLVSQKENENINYFVSCVKENSEKSKINKEEFLYHGAHCFNVKVPDIGPAKAVLYDILSLKKSIELAKNRKSYKPVFYVLACRIGPFINRFRKEISHINGELFVNPDGHEWLREKWNRPTRSYWKFSEMLMIKNADLVICDSLNIEKYIIKNYKKYDPKTTYIAYGTNVDDYKDDNCEKKFENWLEKNELLKSNYFLIVGRFVPENNYESILKSFLKSKTKRNLVIVTNVENNSFYRKLKSNTHFDKDNRIKFVGTVYDQNLLTKIRQNAYAYIHGHKVGGTNPSLLEAMSTTNLNLLYDVGFNREVGRDSAFYWNETSLTNLITQVDKLPNSEQIKLGKLARNIINEDFTWKSIIERYEYTFTNEK